MGLKDAPEKGMIGFDVDKSLLSGRNLLLVRNRFDHTGYRCASEAEEQDFLPRAKVSFGYSCRLEDGNGSLA